MTLYFYEAKRYSGPNLETLGQHLILTKRDTFIEKQVQQVSAATIQTRFYAFYIKINLFQ